MPSLKIFFFFLLPLLSSCTDLRFLSTTITGEISSDGHLYTLIGNYGIWLSIIMYGVFWLLIFLSILIPFETNSEMYSPLEIHQTNRVNMEMVVVKQMDSPEKLSAHTAVPQKPMVLNEHHHDSQLLLHFKVFKISPIYSIWKSRAYGESTKKISLFIINLMTIFMFLSILYNSDRFNVIFRFFF